MRCAIGLVQWLPRLKCILLTGSPGYDPDAAPQGPPRPGSSGTPGTAGKIFNFSAGYILILKMQNLWSFFINFK